MEDTYDFISYGRKCAHMSRPTNCSTVIVDLNMTSLMFMFVQQDLNSQTFFGSRAIPASTVKFEGPSNNVLLDIMAIMFPNMTTFDCSNTGIENEQFCSFIIGSSIIFRKIDTIIANDCLLLTFDFLYAAMYCNNLRVLEFLNVPYTSASLKSFIDTLFTYNGCIRRSLEIIKINLDMSFYQANQERLLRILPQTSIYEFGVAPDWLEPVLFLNGQKVIGEDSRGWTTRFSQSNSPHLKVIVTILLCNQSFPFDYPALSFDMYMYIFSMMPRKWI